MCEGALVCVNPLHTYTHTHNTHMALIHMHTSAVTSMFRMAHQHNLIAGKQKLSSMWDQVIGQITM